MRVSAPGALNPAPDMHVAQSYDFGDFAFVQTSAGVVAIDAGTSPDRVRAAMADLGLKDQAPVSHLILTLAHLDHVGGSDAVRGPDTQVIASAGFPAEAGRLRRWKLPFRYFTGSGTSPAFDVQPDRLIGERTSLVIGDTEFVLIPVRGGERPDALMVHLPASGLLFTGDVLMPYLGVPLTAEGSPEGLLETLRYIRELAPGQLIQGHTTLTGSCRTWSAVMTSSPGSTTSAPDTGKHQWKPAGRMFARSCAIAGSRCSISLRRRANYQRWRRRCGPCSRPRPGGVPGTCRSTRRFEADAAIGLRGLTQCYAVSARRVR